MNWSSYTDEPACDVLDGTDHFAFVMAETDYFCWYVFRKRDGWPVASGLCASGEEARDLASASLEVAD